MVEGKPINQTSGTSLCAAAQLLVLESVGFISLQTFQLLTDQCYVSFPPYSRMVKCDTSRALYSSWVMATTFRMAYLSHFLSNKCIRSTYTDPHLHTQALQYQVDFSLEAIMQKRVSVFNFELWKSLQKYNCRGRQVSDIAWLFIWGQKLFYLLWVHLAQTATKNFRHQLFNK